jgi:non-specific serine/threonine protein kinase/serine/threonine-protein kinase
MEPEGAPLHATDFLFARTDGAKAATPPRIRGVRLDRVLGEGAFGTVWQGEQFDPVLRPVAVKVLRLAALGAQAARRFEAEKVALARLEHPHIAHILDAGTTSEGSPYLVMEFVDGIAFDLWCHRHRDDLEARVRMLATVARAISYAHRQGILHRDLKPQNVLVRSATSAGIGGGGFDEPRVIDFGVAKIVGDDSMRTATVHGPAAATPLYMSPEIASGSNEIDGRVDVWSLGVMLFEALVGTRPFSTERTGMAGTIELQRKIVEGSIPRPSDVLPPNAPRSLRAALEDDLDWIVQRALARPASSRYLTPDELADELDRWLSGEPVLARGAGSAYRIRKFARRNRVAVAAAVAAAGAIGLAAGVLVAANVRAGRDADRWREVALFNERLLTSIDPAVAQGLDPTLLRLILEEAEAEIARGSRDPDVEAEIRLSLGNAYAATGDTDRALEQYEAVRALHVASGSDARALRHVANAIGRALVEGGRLDEAERELVLATDGDDGIAAEALHNRAALERARGELEASEATLREAIRRKRELGLAGVDPLDSEQELALVLAESGRYLDAEPLARHVARKRLEALGARHPDTLRADNNLAEILLARGALAEARALLEPTVRGFEEVLGAGHPDTLAARNNLAGTLRELEDVAGAIVLYEANRRAFVDARGTDDPRSILAGANLAYAYSIAGRAEDAERTFDAVRGDALRVLGPTHRITLANDSNFAAFLVDRARHAEAVVVLERTVPLIERSLGGMNEHPQVMAARTTLARARIGLGEPARALEALAELDAIVGADGAARAPWTRIERRAFQVAMQAAEAAGDVARAKQFGNELAQPSEGPSPDAQR